MPPQPTAASKLRRELHDHCASRNLTDLRETLHRLYEEVDTPLGSAEDIARPAAFAALVEVSCLAQAHAAIHPHDRLRSHIANEMESNVEGLYRGFHVDEDTMYGVRQALYACAASLSVDDAERLTHEKLRDTQLDGRVRLTRHRVSRTPDEREPTS